MKQIVLLAVLLLTFSCTKDLGNYEYQEINAVNFSGIEPLYTVLVGETLQIKPVLKFTRDESGKEDDYTYEWIGFKIETTANATTKFVIANTRNLDQSIGLLPGDYNVHYAVKDKRTGVSYRSVFKLKVETSLNEGWLVLNDVNGQARLDMVSKIKDKYKNITDVLKVAESGLSLRGKPLDVYCYAYNFSEYGVYVSTDQSTDRVDQNTFKWKNTLNLKYEFVASVPDDFHADFFSAIKEPSAYGTSYLFARNKVYFYQSTQSIRYGLPINLVKGEINTFKAAPFVTVAQDPSTLNAVAIMFDVDKKRFLRHGNNENTSSTMANPTNLLFNYNNVGMDLLYMEQVTFNGGEVFALLKNSAGKVFLARFNPTNGIQSYFEEIAVSEISNAEHFAVHPGFGYLFYTIDSKVYEYDTSLKTTKLMLDKGTEKISLMKFQKFAQKGSLRPYNDSRKDQLLLCTYNPAQAADQNGTMELYNVPNLNAALTLGESYTGFGKIVSVSYRER
ncbi:PKD-like family lipoprotein [Pedobacter gandavensis]|uniref:PKD-like family lipoprotein n=1 Tax=Pedobacter gandavensis TaxID=2679963 RepID=UPI00292F5FCE|nr:PKD-like family lipoprotein [Pedobacter gandavensis]